MPRIASNRPTQKVVATSLAGAVATLLIWGMTDFAGIPIPDGVDAAIVTLVSFAIGWLTPPSVHDQVVTPAGNGE